MTRRYLPLVAAALLVGVLGLALRVRSAPGEAETSRPLPVPAAGVSGQATAATNQASPPGPRQFAMVAVGDVMTDRQVGEAIARNGVHSILAKVRDLTSAADVSFANLECPLSTVGPHAPNDCSFRARPATVQVLLDGGFDVVSLANNHSLNAGRAGVLQTLQTLRRHQV